jgi:molybdopterin-guanine dinucleotide biosynthesis protein A
MEDCTGIILAGGKSSRMGIPKGLISYKGKPMISFSINLLSKYCNRILLSASFDTYDHFGLERVPDIKKNAGPMAGLLSCLKQSNSDINLCLPIDVPEIPTAVIDHLLKSAKENPGKCIVPLTPQAEPLIAIYPKSVIPVLEKLIAANNYRMTDIFSHFPVKYIPYEEFRLNDNQDIFININTRNDLQ